MQKKISSIPFSGTPEQEAKLKEVIAKNIDDPGAVMPVLQEAQEIYGYLPIEVQTMVAEGLGVPLEEVYGVSTFYSQFALSPKGKYNISVCLGTACYVKGSGDILNKISENDDAIYSISTSLSTVAFLIHNNDVKNTLIKLNELDNDDVEKIDVTSDVALICCVGDELMSETGASGDIFGAVKAAGANINMISEGASNVAINFVVSNGDALPVIKILHRKFVEGES